MRKLIAGIHRFQKRYWSENRELYRRLAEHGQFPEALFITCSDARVAPLTITHGQPGDLFILRNIGNFVPPYSENALDEAGSPPRWSTPWSTWKCGTSSCAATPTAAR